MKLEVGQFVRTTYGIGRIVNAYIVYDDCGGLWHLSYMTDNPKIEVSIYTKNDSWELFGEVQKDHRIKYEPLENDFDLVKKVYEQELEEIVCYVPVNKNYPRNASLYDDHKFIKASHNIMDLIEEEDLLEIEYFSLRYEKRVTRLFEVTYKEGKFINLDNAKCQFMLIDNDWTDNDKELKPIIKSIVTHEQIEQISYKIKESR